MLNEVIEVDRVEELIYRWEFIANDFSNVEVTLLEEEEGQVIIDYIEAQPKGYGYGTEALKTIMSIATDLGVTIVLDPHPNNFDRLKEYYMRLGFVETDVVFRLKKEPEEVY